MVNQEDRLMKILLTNSKTLIASALMMGVALSPMSVNAFAGDSANGEYQQNKKGNQKGNMISNRPPPPPLQKKSVFFSSLISAATFLELITDADPKAWNYYYHFPLKFLMQINILAVKDLRYHQHDRI